jgi:hypothetical protein
MDQPAHRQPDSIGHIAIVKSALQFQDYGKPLHGGDAMVGFDIASWLAGEHVSKRQFISPALATSTPPPSSVAAGISEQGATNLFCSFFHFSSTL